MTYCASKAKVYLQASNPGFFRFCCKRGRLLRFWVVGLVAGAIDLFALFVFHDLLRVPIISAATLAFVVSFLGTFRLHRRWTFVCHSVHRLQHSLYVANIFACLNLNAILMHILVNRLGVWYLVSQLAANLVIGLYNFLIYRFIIFRPYGHNRIKI